jgi:hypothetical protein
VEAETVLHAEAHLVRGGGVGEFGGVVTVCEVDGVFVVAGLRRRLELEAKASTRRDTLAQVLLGDDRPIAGLHLPFELTPNISMFLVLGMLTVGVVASLFAAKPDADRD